MTDIQNALLEIIELQINSAIENNDPVNIRSNTEFLARAFPRSGMSEREISRLIAEAGVRRSASLAFG